MIKILPVLYLAGFAIASVRCGDGGSTQPPADTGDTNPPPTDDSFVA